MVEINPDYQKLEIECERGNINFYAQEVGFFKSLLEKTENDELRQWFRFFINYSEMELDNANDRLSEKRQKLVDFDQRQREIQPI